MSAITGPIPFHDAPGAVHGGHAPGDNYLNHTRGLKSWLLTLDHKRIGIMYMIGILSAFALGGFFAISLRTVLWQAGPPAGSSAAVQNSYMDLYNHLFTLHGVVMVFLFIIPAVPAIFGNFILPLQL